MAPALAPPKLSPGNFWRIRRVVAYVLMVIFFLVPYLRLNGKPLVLLDCRTDSSR
jgi:hypothetical protein